MKREFPLAFSGEVIGLLGGSFDPAHSGHAHITREALKRFGLDRVWWLVSPANPLKDHTPAPIEHRIARAQKVMDHPKVRITGIEQSLGTRYTAQTLAALKARYPGVRFVWLMGADNLASFHHWRDWGWIMQNVPVGVLARPGDRISARRSVAAQRFEHARLGGSESQLLGVSESPCWCYVNVPLSDASSSKIRASGAW
ncbi:nicotinate-nucleotide adenylyltransferase [uncultured Litoreibacter sp.]|uniref:nicotinate-nucleotide adenylyltransferase n=1 Tax=uncultured Litoreibacter sp. TaxID=1392394 RepID=UPI0026195DCB|nr:nicotinate-nucleotide adenylyltransferase [uncultured Litoreibacter sp.]